MSVDKDGEGKDQSPNDSSAAPSGHGGIRLAEPGAAGDAANVPLGWTQLGGDEQGAAARIRYPQDVVDLDPNETELVIVGTSGQKISHIGPDFSTKVNPNLEQLVFRSHLIRTMEGLQQLTSLQVLELYDNQVDALQCLDEGENGAPGRTLRVLDISYNVIRNMQPVSLCPNLQELYIANNKIKEIAGLRGLKNLRKIDLGANRIRVMEKEELEGLVNLEELWIGKNKIEEIQGLENLKKLRRLDVQSNRLTSIENLQSQVDTLEELYLAHNGIDVEGASRPTGLAQNFKVLNVLDLSRNRLTNASPFAHLKTLEELWLSGNNIASFQDIACLTPFTELDTIYLEYNPLQQDPLYRKKVAETIPCLKQIDATMIGGLAAHGIAPATSVGGGVGGAPPVETEEERQRRLQEQAIERARRESAAKEANP